ncbi:MAG TPA: hypothetical protein VFG68_18230 [Fimbriiglobus sp.]|nr:hypothetical protein [Fimbriiglobus sp.]
MERLIRDLEAHFQADPDYTICGRTHWQPLDGFPNYVPLFDVMVIEGPAPLRRQEDGAIVLDRAASPVTIIDVVSRESCEEEFYDKPDALVRSAVYEYCLFDPSGDVLRPSLHAARKQDGVFHPRRSCLRGVFFSAAGFRLTIRTSAINVSACGQALDEEKLFECQGQLERLLGRADTTEKQIGGLQQRIAQLDQRLANQRARGE